MDHNSRRTRYALLTFLLLGLPLACTLFTGPGQAPPQGWLQSRGPVVPHDTFPADCTECHLSGSWHEIREDFHFDHQEETGVALVGAHQYAECLRCHNDKGPVSQFASRGCAGCHEDWHRRQLGVGCADCHNEVSWQPKEQIVRHNRTRMPLIGAHAGVACWRCHEGAQVGNFKRAPAECESCHQADLARTTAPNHIAVGWTRDCQRCHVPIAWTGAAFVHNFFPLTGAHVPLDCAECHAGGVYQGTPRTCVGCHLPEYNQTTSPNHMASGFPTSCESCHNTSTWQGATFNHSYPLTGAHVQLDCAQCHGGGIYKGTPRTCVGCHLAEYNQTTNPNHASSGFPTSCESCHNTSTWQGAVFNHRFPLVSEHNVACATCHTTPGNTQVFSCIGCHEHRKSEADEEHSEVPGYVYNSNACYSCHPNGK